MLKADRHLKIMEQLTLSPQTRAEDLAQQLGVSLRTLYRDMAQLQKAGLPIMGEAGRGYRLRDDLVTLPPLNLTLAELEALHIGISILAEADDPALRAGAVSLSQKIDAALPETVEDAGVSWGLATLPVAGSEPAIHLLAPLRTAIRKRQKIQITFQEGRTAILRPLALDYLGRIWRLTAQNESENEQQTIPLGHIKHFTHIAEVFPSKTIDF